jgi:hypothetical protein
MMLGTGECYFRQQNHLVGQLSVGGSELYTLAYHDTKPCNTQLSYDKCYG